MNVPCTPASSSFRWEKCISLIHVCFSTNYASLIYARLPRPCPVTSINYIKNAFILPNLHNVKMFRSRFTGVYRQATNPDHRLSVRSESRELNTKPRGEIMGPLISIDLAFHQSSASWASGSRLLSFMGTNHWCAAWHFGIEEDAKAWELETL